MELPNELIIKFISDFCVCRFKDTNHAPEAKPHYYVNVPVCDNSSLLLCIITSQIEKKYGYYSRVSQKALKSLINVDNKSLPILSKDSVIDCNNAELFNKTELLKRVDPKFAFKVDERNIPHFLKLKIIEAIKNSPQIKPYIKKMLKTSDFL